MRPRLRHHRLVPLLPLTARTTRPREPAVETTTEYTDRLPDGAPITRDRLAVGMWVQVWAGPWPYDTAHGPKLLFETMVFGPDNADEYMVRYSTEEQARAGHAETVTVVAATVPDENVTDVDG